MKNTTLLTKMARSMLIAGMVLGITGAAYAQSGAGGAAGGEGAGMGVGSGGIAGQAGSEMSGVSKELPSLRKNFHKRERRVPEPRTGAGAGPDIPPGKKRTSETASRMKEAGAVGGE